MTRFIRIGSWIPEKSSPFGAAGAPAGELAGGATVPAETVQRHACDAALTRITGKAELDAEVSRASRTIPPATRRALAARDGGCIAATCGRPPQWTDAHHIRHWAHGGPTTLENLVLLCGPHHRMVHEEGWQLRRIASGRWALIPPLPRSRSAELESCDSLSVETVSDAAVSQIGRVLPILARGHSRPQELPAADAQAPARYVS